MRVMLDTTYILPLIGVDIKGVAGARQILDLLDSEDQFCVNELSLFEALGKARTLIKDDGTRRRVEEGFEAILHSDRLELLPLMDETTMPLVLDILAEGTRDLPDAVISASAMMNADILLTEAKDIHVLLRERGFSCTNLRDFLS
jgi:predicted nucleic acid-binding protein